MFRGNRHEENPRVEALVQFCRGENPVGQHDAGKVFLVGALMPHHLDVAGIVTPEGNMEPAFCHQQSQGRTPAPRADHGHR